MEKDAADRLKKALDSYDDATTKRDVRAKEVEEELQKTREVFASLCERAIVPALEGVAETIRARGHGATVMRSSAYGAITFEIDVRGGHARERPSLFFRASGGLILVTTTEVALGRGVATWSDSFQPKALTREVVENMAVALTERALTGK